eukprot:31025-Pelagococcus_subviridis.AAC.1
MLRMYLSLSRRSPPMSCRSCRLSRASSEPSVKSSASGNDAASFEASQKTLLASASASLSRTFGTRFKMAHATTPSTRRLGASGSGGRSARRAFDRARVSMTDAAEARAEVARGVRVLFYE